MSEKRETIEQTATLENAGRRKAVKTIVGGITAVAAYNLLPAKWSTPIIESVFLPAHAATSGTTDDATLVDPCQIEDLGYQPDNSLSIRVSGYVTPPIGTLFVKIVASPATDCGADETIYPSTTGETTTAEDGTFSLEIILDPPNTPYTTYRKVDVVTTVTTGAQSSSTCSILVGPCGGGTGSDIVFN